MVIVAGPPGSGKTTRFPVAEFGVDSFNADYRAAQLNAGSFRGISTEIRSQVNVEFSKVDFGPYLRAEKLCPRNNASQ